MGLIAKNTKDYMSSSMSVEVGKYIDKNSQEKPKEIDLRFINSINFRSSSLDSLVNMACGGNTFFGFNNYNKSENKLLIRKGIYPYKYMDNLHRFSETTLPPKSSFCSILNMSGVSNQDYEHVSNQDYEHTCKVWKDFGIRNLGECHNLYLKTDIFLLANIFKAFRKVCLDNYGLNPAHFYTAPGLAWKACLQHFVRLTSSIISLY